MICRGSITLAAHNRRPSGGLCAGQNGRGVFATAALVFFAGFAGTRRAARDAYGFRRLGLGLFCRILFSVLRQLPPALFEVVFQESVHGFGLLNHQDGRFEVSRLDAAEFLERAVEGALGGGAGAVDRDLEAVEFFVRQIIGRRDFEVGATAESP